MCQTLKITLIQMTRAENDEAGYWGPTNSLSLYLGLANTIHLNFLPMCFLTTPVFLTSAKHNHHSTVHTRCDTFLTFVTSCCYTLQVVLSAIHLFWSDKLRWDLPSNIFSSLSFLNRHRICILTRMAWI